MVTKGTERARKSWLRSKLVRFQEELTTRRLGWSTFFCGWNFFEVARLEWDDMKLRTLIPALSLTFAMAIPMAHANPPGPKAVAPKVAVKATSPVKAVKGPKATTKHHSAHVGQSKAALVKIGKVHARKSKVAHIAPKAHATPKTHLVAKHPRTAIKH